jgi:hypothetical protein
VHIQTATASEELTCVWRACIILEGVTEVPVENNRNNPRAMYEAILALLGGVAALFVLLYGMHRNPIVLWKRIKVPKDVILALDVGSSSIRCSAFDSQDLTLYITHKVIAVRVSHAHFIHPTSTS